AWRCRSGANTAPSRAWCRAPARRSSAVPARRARRGWSLTLKGFLDGVIYAALTAGTFGWLWPR
ncbi:MAG TPA: hypothetical protein VEY89_14320, partial [Candidatus Dormibacteraeota bacterium]|nr:hypothetical protein [Candidatus Dormibacteraeota bacterium]